MRYKHLFGFVTTSKTRDELYGFIEEAVGTTGDKIYYTKLIDELVSLKEKGGRIDHDSKGHDDLVIAWLLTFWFMKLGQSKSEYGIPPGIVMRDISLLRLNDPSKRKMSDPQTEAMVKLYKARLEQYTEHLMRTDDPAIANRLENLISKITSMIPPESRKSITIDEIKAMAKEARNKRSMDMRRRRMGFR